MWPFGESNAAAMRGRNRSRGSKTNIGTGDAAKNNRRSVMQRLMFACTLDVAR
jgi:hypothetical protein